MTTSTQFKRFSTAIPRWLTSGWTAGVISLVFFSFNTPISKAILEQGVPASLIMFIRFGVGILLLGAAIALSDPTRLVMSRRAILLTTIAGLINGVGVLSFYASLNYISGSLSTMIFATNPLFILVMLALFAGEKLTGRHLVRLALGFAGGYLLIGPTAAAINPLGIGLTLISVLCVTIELFVLQQYLRQEDSRTVTFYLLIAMWLSITAGSALTQMGWTPLSPAVWAGILLMAALGTFLGWWLMFRAIHDIGSGQYALLSPLETVLSVVWLTLFLGESLHPWQYAGGVLILLSALLASSRQRRRWISTRKPTLR